MADVKIKAKMFVKSDGSVRAVRAEGVPHGMSGHMNPAPGEQTILVTLDLPESFFEERLKINVEVPEIKDDKAKTTFIFDDEKSQDWA